VQLVIFYLYLMLHACAAKFDVIRNLKNFWKLTRLFSSKFFLVFTSVALSFLFDNYCPIID